MNTLNKIKSITVGDYSIDLYPIYAYDFFLNLNLISKTSVGLHTISKEELENILKVVLSNCIAYKEDKEYRFVNDRVIKDVFGACLESIIECINIVIEASTPEQISKNE